MCLIMYFGVYLHFNFFQNTNVIEVFRYVLGILDITIYARQEINYLFK